jgi:hypothetical protein
VNQSVRTVSPNECLIRRQARRKPTSSSDAEILPEDPPVSILHLVQRLLRPMTIVCSRPRSCSSLERIRVLILLPSADLISPPTSRCHPSHATSKHDTRSSHPRTSPSCDGRYRREPSASSRILLCLPVENELLVADLASFSLLVRVGNAEVAGFDRGEVEVGFGGDGVGGRNERGRGRDVGRGRCC